MKRIDIKVRENADVLLKDLNWLLVRSAKITVYFNRIEIIKKNKVFAISFYSKLDLDQVIITGWFLDLILRCFVENKNLTTEFTYDNVLSFEEAMRDKNNDFDVVFSIDRGHDLYVMIEKT